MRCASVQERLADEGVTLIHRDAAIREHVAGCSDCGGFLEALERLDAGMSELPPLAAPAALVARTAQAVAREAKSASGAAGRMRSWRFSRFSKRSSIRTSAAA